MIIPKAVLDLLVKVRNFLDGRSILPSFLLMIGFELGLKINFHGGGGGWPDQMGIRLTSASTGVGVEVGAELGNILSSISIIGHIHKRILLSISAWECIFHVIIL